MKTRVYIDGANFYFGLLKGHPEWKWLDLKGLVALLVRSDHEVDAIQYFTSYIKTHPYDHAAIERQNVYLQGIEAFGGVEIIFGKYNKNKTYLPPIEDKCLGCGATRNGLVRVMKFEEKRTDVNLATSMLRDAYTNAADSFVLISGDSDFIAPLDLIRYELGKQVVVFNPKDRKSDLANHASYYRDIPRDLPARCQLPDAIPVGTHGNVIRRPAAWQ